MNAPHRVLFVEDYAPFKRSFARLLTRGFGLAVTVAGSGEEAIGQFGAISPDLVILDLGLPGVDGTETLQVIRALPGGEDVPVIVLTGSHDPEMMDATARLDVEGYVLKENATKEFADHILAVFPDLDGQVSERFRLLAGSVGFKGARPVLEKNIRVVGRIPNTKRANRVLLLRDGENEKHTDGRWTRRLMKRVFGGAS